jgi:hypothetical protein
MRVGAPLNLTDTFLKVSPMSLFIIHQTVAIDWISLGSTFPLNSIENLLM